MYSNTPEKTNPYFTESLLSQSPIFNQFSLYPNTICNTTSSYTLPIVLMSAQLVDQRSPYMYVPEPVTICGWCLPGVRCSKEPVPGSQAAPAGTRSPLPQPPPPLISLVGGGRCDMTAVVSLHHAMCTTARHPLLPTVLKPAQGQG